MTDARTIPACEFGKKGGARCDLTWPGRKGDAGSPAWERAISRDMCLPCGAEVRRRHAKVRR